MAFLLTIFGVVLALPVLVLVGIALGPAALFMVFMAGCALVAAAVAWVVAHSRPHQ